MVLKDRKSSNVKIIIKINGSHLIEFTLVEYFNGNHRVLFLQAVFKPGTNVIIYKFCRV